MSNYVKKDRSIYCNVCGSPPNVACDPLIQHQQRNIRKQTYFKIYSHTTGYCSSCGKSPVGENGVFIKGHLKGSGAGGFLELCLECKNALIDELTNFPISFKEKENV